MTAVDPDVFYCCCCADTGCECGASSMEFDGPATVVCGCCVDTECKCEGIEIRQR